MMKSHFKCGRKRRKLRGRRLLQQQQPKCGEIEGANGPLPAYLSSHPISDPFYRRPVSSSSTIMYNQHASNQAPPELPFPRPLGPHAPPAKRFVHCADDPVQSEYDYQLQSLSTVLANLEKATSSTPAESAYHGHHLSRTLRLLRKELSPDCFDSTSVTMPDPEAFKPTCWVDSKALIRFSFSFNDEPDSSASSSTPSDYLNSFKEHTEPLNPLLKVITPEQAQVLHHLSERIYAILYKHRDRIGDFPDPPALSFPLLEAKESAIVDVEEEYEQKLSDLVREYDFCHGDKDGVNAWKRLEERFGPLNDLMYDKPEETDERALLDAMVTDSSDCDSHDDDYDDDDSSSGEPRLFRLLEEEAKKKENEMEEYDEEYDFDNPPPVSWTQIQQRIIAIKADMGFNPQEHRVRDFRSTYFNIVDMEDSADEDSDTGEDGFIVDKLFNEYRRYSPRGILDELEHQVKSREVFGDLPATWTSVRDPEFLKTLDKMDDDLCDDDDEWFADYGRDNLDNIEILEPVEEQQLNVFDPYEKEQQNLLEPVEVEQRSLLEPVEEQQLNVFESDDEEQQNGLESDEEEQQNGLEPDDEEQMVKSPQANFLNVSTLTNGQMGMVLDDDMYDVAAHNNIYPNFLQPDNHHLQLNGAHHQPEDYPDEEEEDYEGDSSEVMIVEAPVRVNGFEAPRIAVPPMASVTVKREYVEDQQELSFELPPSTPSNQVNGGYHYDNTPIDMRSLTKHPDDSGWNGHLLNGFSGDHPLSGINRHVPLSLAQMHKYHNLNGDNNGVDNSSDEHERNINLHATQGYYLANGVPNEVDVNANSDHHDDDLDGESSLEEYEDGDSEEEEEDFNEPPPPLSYHGQDDDDDQFDEEQERLAPPQIFPSPPNSQGMDFEPILRDSEAYQNQSIDSSSSQEDDFEPCKRLRRDSDGPPADPTLPDDINDYIEMYPEALLSSDESSAGSPHSAASPTDDENENDELRLEVVDRVPQHEDGSVVINRKIVEGQQEVPLEDYNGHGSLVIDNEDDKNDGPWLEEVVDNVPQHKVPSVAIKREIVDGQQELEDLYGDGSLVIDDENDDQQRALLLQQALVVVGTQEFDYHGNNLDMPHEDDEQYEDDYPPENGQEEEEQQQQHHHHQQHQVLQSNHIDQLELQQQYLLNNLISPEVSPGQENYAPNLSITKYDPKNLLNRDFVRDFCGQDLRQLIPPPPPLQNPSRAYLAPPRLDYSAIAPRKSARLANRSSSSDHRHSRSHSRCSCCVDTFDSHRSRSASVNSQQSHGQQHHEPKRKLPRSRSSSPVGSAASSSLDAVVSPKMGLRNMKRPFTDVKQRVRASLAVPDDGGAPKKRPRKEDPSEPLIGDGGSVAESSAIASTSGQVRAPKRKRKQRIVDDYEPAAAPPPPPPKAPLPKVATSQPVVNRKNRRQCPYCNKIVKSKLERHINTHYNFKPFECTKCSKKFTEYCYSSQHVMSEHHILADQAGQFIRRLSRPLGPPPPPPPPTIVSAKTR